MRTSFIYSKPTSSDNQFSTVNGILKHFLQHPEKSRPSIESKIEGVSFKVFFREGKWIHFHCNKGYALPRVSVFPDTPKIREIFGVNTFDWRCEKREFTYNSEGILDVTVPYQFQLLASETDLKLDYSDKLHC